MEFDFSKLVGRIIEKFGTRAAFAAAAGYTESALSYRLNNKVKFSLPEMYLIIQLLEIDPADISLYFFTPKVR